MKTYYMNGQKVYLADEVDQQLIEAKEVIKFYANIDNWYLSKKVNKYFGDEFKFDSIINDLGIGEFIQGEEDDENVGGLKARQFLKKYPIEYKIEEVKNDY